MLSCNRNGYCDKQTKTSKAKRRSAERREEVATMIEVMSSSEDLMLDYT